MSKHYLEAELEDLFQKDPKMWQFIQHGSLDGVWYWDLEKPDIEWMSPEMWTLFGVDPATMRHDPAEWQDLIFEDDLKVALENFEKHCADKTHPYDQIVRYRHADGSTVWVRCRGIAIRDESGKPIRMLGAHNDITGIKNAEQEARDALRETKAANNELRDFAYGISHDLKAPSNTIDMLLQEIVNSDDGNLSDDQRQLAKIAQHTAQQMGRLVEDMLVYTRLIGEDPKWEQVSIKEVVHDIEELLAGLIQQTGAKIIVDDQLPTVSGHPAQLRTLVQNLIENAIKYRHPDRPPVVTVSNPFSARAGKKGFAVSDNGVGIAPEYQDRVFELFKRLHRSDEVPGAGIGLTLGRRVVLNHGGDIKIASDPGKGSTFTVSLSRKRS